MLSLDFPELVEEARLVTVALGPAADPSCSGTAAGDFASTVDSIKVAAPDAVFFSAEMPPAAELVVKLRDAGVTPSTWCLNMPIRQNFSPRSGRLVKVPSWCASANCPRRDSVRTSRRRSVPRQAYSPCRGMNWRPSPSTVTPPEASSTAPP